MNSETFRKQVEKELKKLTKEQVVHFAWLCAVRALPFLGSKGNFYFWNIEDRQKHLFSVFYALDVNASYINDNDSFDDNDNTIDEAYATAITAARNAVDAAATAYASFYSASSFSDSKASATFAYAFSSYAAADSDATAARTASDSANSAKFAAITVYESYANFDDVFSAAAANSAFSSISAASLTKKVQVDLKSIILSDLKSIQNNNREQTNPSLYAEVWLNFQKALEAEGCAYWGRLYQTIFESGFVLDQEALKRRMSVPQEIREKGAAEVASYLEALEEQGAERFNEARIIILGDKGAGKTCLSRRLVDPDAPMTTDKESTPGVDTTLWKLKKENINVHIWDFAGHTVTHAVHQLFLSERCLYVIVYDGRTEERNQLVYWLNHIKNYGGDSKAIILVNERDQHSVKIPINSLQEQYPIQGVYTFSIQDDKEKLSNFRKEVAGFIMNNPSWNKLEIPAKYFQVKEALEELFVNGNKENSKEHITKEEFDRIAKSKGIADDKIEELLTNLHDLGVSLRYKDMEDFDMLVLNPEWISHGVYKIINWANEAKKYALTIGDFASVFLEDANRYPENKYKFLFGLMKRYELAYETKEGNTLIIPHLLNEDQPAKLPDFPVSESLMLRYKAEQPLPPNTISRFIVRHNEQIKKEGTFYLVWRYGVILQDTNGSIALVREEDRTISVSVKGQDKTNYISILRETLNDIFNSYKSKKPELQYRIERLAIEPGNVPIWISENEILNHAIAGKESYYASTINQEIPTKIIIQNFYNSGSGYMFIAHTLDNSIHNTFNFHDCNIGLQGSLNDLSDLLKEKGKEEEAKGLENTAKALEQVEKCTKEEVKKKGIGNKLKRLIQDMGDENSDLHKTVEGFKSVIDIGKTIVEPCLKILQWIG